MILYFNSSIVKIIPDIPFVTYTTLYCQISVGFSWNILRVTVHCSMSLTKVYTKYNLKCLVCQVSKAIVLDDCLREIFVQHCIILHGVVYVFFVAILIKDIFHCTKYNYILVSCRFFANKQEKLGSHLDNHITNQFFKHK